MSNRDWLPEREQDLVDLYEKWKAEFKKPANAASFGWDTDAVTEAMSAVHVFLSTRAAYKEDNSTKNRMMKDEAKEAAKKAMRDFANSSIRFNKKMRPEDCPKASGFWAWSLRYGRKLHTLYRRVLPEAKLLSYPA